MGYFDNNIHMNGAGTTYQAFLDLADAAEAKGGMIGERTVRLVKAVRGLDADTRGKLLEDAEQASSGKSREIQAKAAAEADKQQARIVAHEARYWSAANACVMQLQQAIG